MYIDNDPTPLFLVAKAICKLQALYGIIPRVFGKGKKAKVRGVHVSRSAITFPIQISTSNYFAIFSKLKSLGKIAEFSAQ